MERALSEVTAEKLRSAKLNAINLQSYSILQFCCCTFVWESSGIYEASRWWYKARACFKVPWSEVFFTTLSFSLEKVERFFWEWIFLVEFSLLTIVNNLSHLGPLITFYQIVFTFKGKANLKLFSFQLFSRFNFTFSKTTTLLNLKVEEEIPRTF